MQVSFGSTDVSVDLRAMDANGALTGKVAADFTAWYRRDGAKVAVVLADLTALTDAHTDGGVYEIGNGWYRFDLPDAAFLAGANRVAVGGTVASGTLISAPISLTSGETTGTGVNTVTITVNDGTNPLESAKVRMTKGAETYLRTTNASGVATFWLDNGTWSVAITLPLYTFTSTTRVVDGTETQTYSMTAQTIPASDVGTVSGYLYCYDDEGAVEKDVVVTCRCVKPPTNASGSTDATGAALSGIEHSETSDANGLVTFLNLVPGATYTIYGGDSSKARTTTIAVDAASPVALPSIVWTA